MKNSSENKGKDAKVDKEMRQAMLKLANGYDYEDKEVIADASGQV